MMIWMDDALFSGSRYIDCLSVLHNAAIRGHSLTISNDPSARRGSPNFDEWKRSLSEKIKHEVDNILDKLKVIPSNIADRGFSKRLLITNREFSISNVCFVRLDEAVRAVSLPLHILVENQINDAAFLRHVMPPDCREELEKLERRGQIRYIQGGGLTEILKLIKFHIKDDNSRLVFGLPADVWKLLHFIIYDHDGKTSDSPSYDSKKTYLICEDNDMLHRSHRLMRKSQENYIPVDALKEIVNFKKKINNSQKEETQRNIGSYEKSGDKRFFEDVVKLSSNEKLFKSVFGEDAYEEIWKDEWFEKDGSWPEMRKLAESIVSSM
ncbi:hypothetical protein HMY34_18945 [Thiothrix subterranea]|uniref:hypothetical protein n=1 Tax=Thiothrix subterranea TaxID=2735563 RepID=UPI00192B36D6|nr:hypothetical protein [Thiothrix subterranea]QQZ30662.1 hypothetical protein HMY34_18945 [Thiothrix subterranea]